MREFIQRIQIGLRARNHDIGVGTHAIDDAPRFRQPHCHFALRIRAFGDVIDRIQKQLRVALRHTLQRLEGRIHRPGTFRFAGFFAAAVGDDQTRIGFFTGFDVRRE